MNITDVGHLTSDADTGEDKLEQAAKRTHKSAQTIAEQYTKQFVADASRLNIIPPSKLVKATDHIAEQISFISKLAEKGYTYPLDDGLYFDTSKVTYGVFGQQLSAERQQRVTKAQKKQPEDFALWRLSDERESRQQEWDAPWGRGYPGWHIECSAMATKYLGEQFDLHLGGVDHLSIHHENEIAQNRAAFGKLLAKHWFHVNFLVIKGKKMARSKQGFLTLDDLIAKQIEPLAFRLYCLHHHYRSVIEFDLDTLAQMQQTLNTIRLSLYRHPSLPVAKSHSLDNFLYDDLAIPQLLAELHKKNDPNLWLHYDTVLDLGLSESSRELSHEQQELMDRRDAARAKGDFAAADLIRDKLATQRIIVEDTKDGSRSYRLPEVS